MGEEHFYWVLSHMWDLAGDPDIYDVCDYFSALYDEEIRRNLGYQVGDEPWKDWNPRMNLETTMQRCELWHQDAGQDHWGGRAKRYTGPFPEPWLDGMKKGAFEIMPIINGADLHEEGKRMHHCVSGYSKMVLHGECYIYSVRKKDKRVATLEIIKNKGFNDPVQTYKVVQSRGPCNADPSKEVKKLIDDWMVKSNKKQWQKAREQDGKRL
jgi:PcfJ-like protein